MVALYSLLVKHMEKLLAIVKPNVKMNLYAFGLRIEKITRIVISK